MTPTAVMIAAFGPLVVAGVIVGASLGMLHLLFLPGLFVEHDLPRPVAYAVGMGVIGVVWSGLFLVARPVDGLEWLPVLDLWTLMAVGAVPTIGLRGAKSVAREKRMEALNERDA